MKYKSNCAVILLSCYISNFLEKNFLFFEKACFVMVYAYTSRRHRFVMSCCLDELLRAFLVEERQCVVCRLVALLRQQAKIIAEAKGLDLILSDGPPGIGCPVHAAITGADGVVVVTEPTEAGIHVVVATGRRYSRTLHLVEPLGIDVPLITASQMIPVSISADPSAVYRKNFIAA